MVMSKQVRKQVHMLTTTDNPFHPVTQFNEWYMYDTTKGYHSLALLARVSFTTDSIGDENTTEVIEESIEEIVRENVSGMHTSILVEQIE